MWKEKKELALDIIQQIPFNKRRSVRAVAKHSGIKKSTLQDAINAGLLVWHSNAVKPTLTPANQLERLRYCLAQISQETILENPTFDGFYNRIHLDEKWFYIFEENQRMLLVPGETAPHRTCKSKRFIRKIMFLCAIARPRFDQETNECIFDGKIGIWPFIEEVEAQRSSRNRPRGMLEIKAIDVNRDVSREYMTDYLLPGIMVKFPDVESVIYLQQDNARAHIHPDDEVFSEAAILSGLNLEFIKQPPNSPDTNICDLGFFRAIQSLQQEEIAETLEQAYSQC
jgi:hypothetical protein